MRKFMGAKDGYYGNCVANHLLAVATRGTVAEAGIVDLTKMIKRAKDQLPHKVKMGNKSGNDDDLMRGLCGRYDMMHVSSWKNIGFEQVDFGSGAPARVIFHVREGTPPVPTCIMYPPCKGRDGLNLLSTVVHRPMRSRSTTGSPHPNQELGLCFSTTTPASSSTQTDAFSLPNGGGSGAAGGSGSGWAGGSDNTGGATHWPKWATDPPWSNEIFTNGMILELDAQATHVMA
ncbi:hypothetical protein HU200_052749 [Digitaria exilis]|uniref:Uncharacterized protein n=1 Tax=Digitaria exilis TaxID=1010633 RepID=A0A835ALI6_9POAL|nr:hypothetical protein HU200_052749 [Digitaria exilis]